MTFDKKKWSSEYYLRNKERIRKRNEKWRKANPDKALKNRTLWRKRNPKKVSEIQKRYYLSDPDRRRLQWKKSRDKHKVQRLVYIREYFQKNPSAQHRYKVKNSIGKFTAQEWRDLKRKYKNICAICKKRRKLTVDHIIPLSKGGVNWIQNIQPLCQPCNSSKGAKLNTNAA